MFCHALHVRVCMLGSIEPLSPVHPVGPIQTMKSQSVVMLRCIGVKHAALYTWQGYQTQTAPALALQVSS